MRFSICLSALLISVVLIPAPLFAATISGTVRDGEGAPIGEFAARMLSCMDCDFFKKVVAEEGSANFELMIPRMKYRPKVR